MKKPFAFFTIVRDETVFLPIALRYYRQHFDDEDIYVLDNDTADGSTDALPCNRVSVSNQNAFDHRWLKNTVRAYQRRLLEDYHYVVFAEVDEIIWSPVGLRSRIESLSGQVNDVTCKGRELIHMTDKEPALELSKPVMSQRAYWYESLLYSKTLIANHALDWTVGFHRARNCTGFQHDVYLIHLHRMDFDLGLERNEGRKRLVWSEHDLQNGRGYQNRVTGKEYAEWFYEDRYADGPIQRIPENLRTRMHF